MAQEFTIKSAAIEDKINQLLPSQGGFQAGVDFSASTMVIPVVDLTETAEGSNVREDLQKALTLDGITSYSVENTTTTVWNTTGYILMKGFARGTTNQRVIIALTDGVTTKNIVDFDSVATGSNGFGINYEYIILVKAGESITVQSNGASCMSSGCLRQIADLDGNLISP